ncbi:MAG TPA: sugar ABC transporter permease [bacterium]|nr:sugar ABC transporter permease [bacterium]
MERTETLLAVVIGAPVASAAYILCAEAALRRLAPGRQRLVRPWLWVGPALLLLVVFLVYPVVDTLALSFRDAAGRTWVGFANYRIALSDPDTLRALWNTMLWVVGFTGLSVGFGLAVAVLADRVRYEAVVKAIVFLPMALSFTAAGVIWKFVYEFRPAGAPQIGALNALLVAIVPGFTPRAWLTLSPENTPLLIAVGVWIWTGFCAVVLSAALKNVPRELIEAARIDGAGDARVFRQVQLPGIAPVVASIAITMLVTALKVFDVVYVMTSGNYGTDVVANRMYSELFTFRHPGRASALAAILLVGTIPLVVAVMRRAAREDAFR